MPTYRQNDPGQSIVPAKPLKFGLPANQVGGAVARIPAGPLELGFTLDTSSSMGHLLDAAANGFNKFLEEQCAAGPGYLSFNCFSSEVYPVCTGAELGTVEPVTRAFLAKRCGSTALLDGIGNVIKAVADRFDKLPNPRKGALVAILTDGMENCSKKFRHAEIFELIHYRRSVHQWEFLFLCASESAERYGLLLGIKKANICRFDTSPEGIKLLLGRLSKAAGAFRLGNRNFAGYLTGRTV